MVVPFATAVGNTSELAPAAAWKPGHTSDPRCAATAAAPTAAALAFGVESG